MKRNTISLIAISISVLFTCTSLISCKDGASQPPRPGNVFIMRPSYGIMQKSAPTQEVGIKTLIRVKTTDNSDNIVTYPGPITDTRYTSATQPFLDDKEYTLQQPEGATKFVLDILIETKQCAWPIPGTTWSGGQMTWEYTSPQYTYPKNVTISRDKFAILSKEPC